MNAGPPEAAACGFFRWSAWGGSVELVAQVVRAAQRAVVCGSESGPATRSSGSCDLPLRTGEVATAKLQIVVLVNKDEERFDSAEDLVRLLTPEATAKFDRVEIHARSTGLSVHVSFVRKGGDREPEGVRLAVWSADSGGEVAAQKAAQAIAHAVNRGFRSVVGATAGTSNLDLDPRRKVAIAVAPLISWAAPFVLGVTVILTFIECVKLLFPHAHLSAAIYTSVCVLIGVAYPLAWRWYVQDVELAKRGRTRLAFAVHRSIQGIVALLVTTAIKVLIHAT